MVILTYGITENWVFSPASKKSATKQNFHLPYFIRDGIDAENEITFTVGLWEGLILKKLQLQRTQKSQKIALIWGSTYGQKCMDLPKRHLIREQWRPKFRKCKIPHAVTPETLYTTENLVLGNLLPHNKSRKTVSLRTGQKHKFV